MPCGAAEPALPGRAPARGPGAECFQRRQSVASRPYETSQAHIGVAQNSTGGANRRCWSMFPLTRASHFGIPVFEPKPYGVSILGECSFFFAGAMTQTQPVLLNPVFRYCHRYQLGVCFQSWCHQFLGPILQTQPVRLNPVFTVTTFGNQPFGCVFLELVPPFPRCCCFFGTPCQVPRKIGRRVLEHHKENQSPFAGFS